ncbi:MAG TPA: DciA family protein [Stellaceae bacterium]|nr:DciA family protein [Stellaceae bacterium]
MSEANLPRDDDGGERRPGFRAAGASLSRLVAPIVARHGGGVLARLKADWAAIVGPELAVATWPEALGRGGVLKLRVTSAKALEIQHRAPLLAERINLFFGREAVTRLALVQGPLPLPDATAARESIRPLATSEAAVLGRQLAEIGDPELRQALDRLGRAVIGTTEC